MSADRWPLTVATREDEVVRAAERLGREARVALDLEYNGLHAYRARVCTVQLAAGGEVWVVDALAAPLAPLAGLLGESGPIKVVHDVAFDARMLAEAGLALGNCHDTSLAARMLSRPATGLGALLLGELGVAVDKAMQSHDWGRRPLDARALGYLAADVAHLHALDDALWGAVLTAGIEAEVLEETRYRLAAAVAAAAEGDPRPPYARIKGVERVPTADLPVLRRLAEAREQAAVDLDVPVYKVLSNDVLLAIARAKPRSTAELHRVPGATQGPRAAALAGALLAAVVAGGADGPLPDGELARFAPPRVPRGQAEARRAREGLLSAWRRDVAKARGVDEQVVLPGHCLKEIASRDGVTLESLGQVAGVGLFRVERDGAAILRALGGGGG